MASKAKRRKRINPVVRLVSAIYDMDYILTMKLYNQFNRDLAVLRMHLNRFKHVETELNTINEINLSY